MKKLFLVVPCLNEAEALPVSLPRMLEVLDTLDSDAVEAGIIVADDGSTDGTARVLEEFPDKRVQHLRLEHSGQQGAILGGLKAALDQGADAVITLDADLQDDPAAIPEMVQKWLGGKDVVYGVRNARGYDTFFKKASAWLFYSLMRLADRRHLMGHADFRLMSRPCMERILEVASPTGDLLRNLVPTLGFDGAIVHYARGDRSAGESKYGLFQMMRFSWKGIVAQVPFCMIILCLVTFAAFFLTSVDSPLHDSMVAHGHYVRHDSAWYFMCGKAWMNGLSPYVDFSDSKGPLLWLFYALAYLISPRSWMGVFWINALAYIVTSCLLFKVSLLLTDSPKKSLWMGILLLPIYFIPPFIFDDKAEAIALPFVALSMLMACKSVYGKGGSFFWWGFAFGAIVLIKFNIAAMTGIFFIAMAVRLKGWKAFFSSAGLALAGFAVAVLPITAYFLWKGLMGAFIQEYFVTTYVTMSRVIERGDSLFAHKKAVSYMCLALAGTISSAFVLRKGKWFPPVALAWFFLCLGPYARTYYMIPVNVLAVFTALVIVRCFDGDFGYRRYVFGAIIAAAVVFVGSTNHNSYKRDYFYGRNMNLFRERAREYVDLLSSEHNPRVLYWHCGDHGYGIEAEDLPACRYWAMQAGHTPEMDEEQENCAKNLLADFVFVHTYDKRRQQMLLEWGYTHCYKPRFGTYRVFRRGRTQDYQRSSGSAEDEDSSSSSEDEDSSSS